MPKPNLSRMDINSLMDLRDQVDQRLREHRVELQKQLERIALLGGESVQRGRPGGSALKGRKVPPKYRSASGETWAGRGARPVWLEAAIKSGKKLENFLIDKSGRQKKR